MSLTARQVLKNVWETSLDVRITLGHPAGPAFMVEVSQHGRVSMTKVSDPEELMNVYMGSFLMAYVRHYTAEAFTRAGFPPLMLPEMDWAKAYVERKTQEAAPQQDVSSEVQGPAVQKPLLH